MNKKLIINKLKEEINFLSSNYSVKSIGLYGSYVRNENSKNSDIDLLIDFSNMPDIFQFVELSNYLSKKLNRKIDLVTVDSVRPEIKTQVFNEAVFI